MSNIAVGTGVDAKLTTDFVEEVRTHTSSSAANEVWHALTTDPLSSHANCMFADLLSEQDPDDTCTLDRLHELYDQYVEFVKEATGKHPSQLPHTSRELRR